MNVYVRETAARIAAGGTAVDVFTRRSDLSLANVVEAAPRLRVIQVPAGPPRAHADLLRRWIAEFRAGVESFAQADGVRYDGIVSHYWLSGLAAVRLAARWRVPHIAAFHTLELAKEAVYPASCADPERVRGELRVTASADALLAAGLHERDELIGRYRADPRKIHVATPGVDQELFRPRDRAASRERIGLPLDRPIVLLVGRAVPLKGGEVLLRGLAGIAAERRPDTIVVGGETGGEAQARLLELARALGVAEAVRFVGSVRQEELTFYYGAADIVAAPSHYESYGLAALEAQACGRAVVASRVGGLPSVVREGVTGLLTTPGDSEALGAAILRLLEDPALADGLGQAGAEAAAEREWRITADVALEALGALQTARVRASTAESPIQVGA